MMSLKKNGFKKFKFLKINKYFSISKNISIKVIPQLNDFGQEISEYESNPSNPYVSFDTGLLIKDAINDQYHALLGDNTPYNIKQFSKCIGNNDLHSLWFPFNGFAHDYPLTYENIPTKSKVKISEQSCQKRNDLLLDVYEHLKPKFLIPHSADFRLTGKKSILFRQVHNKKFRSRFLYSKWLLNTFKLPAIYLGVGDEITFSDYDQSYKINKSLNIRSQRTLPIKSTKSQTYFQSLNSNDLRSALSKMNSRCNQYGLNFKDFHDWIFAIDLSDSKRTYFIDFSKKSITKRLDNNCKKKRLTLKISSSKLNKILLREDHLNNCIIGHELKWERQPNVYNQHLYNALNFFHL